jgi:hypothetical protein
MASISSVTQADIINVPGDQPTIQAGIDAAVNADEVVVGDGTYTGPGNRDLDFGGKLITVRSASGDPSLCIIDCEGSEESPHRAFFLHSGETSDAVIDGLTIMNGAGDISYDGAGIRCEGSGVTITNCVFFQNSGAPFGWGGAIYCRLGGSVIVSNCTFTFNSAGCGGAIHCRQGTNIEILDCTFAFNSGGTCHGGGVFFGQGDGTGVVSGCTFEFNHADWGGALAAADVLGSLSIVDCTFDHNDAVHDSNGGGAVFFSGVDDGQIVGCEITNNTAAGGGGIYTQSSGQVVIRDCVITDNMCTRAYPGGGGVTGDPAIMEGCTIAHNSSAGWGGGLSIFGDGTILNCQITNNTAIDGAGLFCHTRIPVELVNCLVTDNTATGMGGGMLIWRKAAITNCTIVGNMANTGGGVAVVGTEGAVECPDICTEVELRNSVLWGDSAVQGDELLLANNMFDDPSVLTVSHSNVAGGEAGASVEPGSVLIWGVGNIDVDPLFVDPDNGDLHLSPGSPCIDAGDNTAVPAGITTDLDGNPRFVDDPNTGDTGNPDGVNPIVDMGAYEFQVCPWDIAGPGGGPPDGTVAVNDFLELLATWGCVGCPADFLDPPGVGLEDVQYLLDNWGTACPGEAASEPPSLPDEIENAGLQWPDDWDIFVDCITSGTPEAQANVVCWLSYYLEPWPWPDCPGDDPFASSSGPQVIPQHQPGASSDPSPGWTPRRRAHRNR